VPRTRKIIIDPEQLKSLIQKVDTNETTLTDVAAVFGVSADTIRSRCLQLGIRKPRRRNKDPLHVRLQEKFTTEQLKALSQYDIAKTMDCAQPYVSKAPKRLGIKSNYHERCKEKTQREIEQVINHIQNNGGRVKSTIRKLGLKIDRFISLLIEDTATGLLCLGTQRNTRNQITSWMQYANAAVKSIKFNWLIWYKLLLHVAVPVAKVI